MADGMTAKEMEDLYAQMDPNAQRQVLQFQRMNPQQQQAAIARMRKVGSPDQWVRMAEQLAQAQKPAKSSPAQNGNKAASTPQLRSKRAADRMQGQPIGVSQTYSPPEPAPERQNTSVEGQPNFTPSRQTRQEDVRRILGDQASMATPSPAYAASSPLPASNATVPPEPSPAASLPQTASANTGPSPDGSSAQMADMARLMASQMQQRMQLPKSMPLNMGGPALANAMAGAVLGGVPPAPAAAGPQGGVPPAPAAAGPQDEVPPAPAAAGEEVASNDPYPVPGPGTGLRPGQVGMAPQPTVARPGNLNPWDNQAEEFEEDENGNMIFDGDGNPVIKVKPWQMGSMSGELFPPPPAYNPADWGPVPGSEIPAWGNSYSEWPDGGGVPPMPSPPKMDMAERPPAPAMPDQLDSPSDDTPTFNPPPSQQPATQPATNQTQPSGSQPSNQPSGSQPSNQPSGSQPGGGQPGGGQPSSQPSGSQPGGGDAEEDRAPSFPAPSAPPTQPGQFAFPTSGFIPGQPPPFGGMGQVSGLGPPMGMGGGGNATGQVPTPDQWMSPEQEQGANEFLQGTFDQYQQAMDAANQANEDRYNQGLGLLSGMNAQQNQMLGGLGNLYGDRTNLYAQGANSVMNRYNDPFSFWASTSANVGRGWDALNQDVMGRTGLMGATEAENIRQRFGQQAAQAEQDLISRGLGNTTIRPAVQRGIAYDQSRAQTGLAEDVNNQLNQLDMGTRMPMLNWAGNASQFGAGLLGNTAQAAERAIGNIANLQGEGLQFGERANQAQQAIGQQTLNWIGNRTDQAPDYNTMAGLASQIAAGGVGWGNIPSLPAPTTARPPQSPSLPYMPPQQQQQRPSNLTPATRPTARPQSPANRQPWATIL